MSTIDIAFQTPAHRSKKYVNYTTLRNRPRNLKIASNTKNVSNTHKSGPQRNERKNPIIGNLGVPSRAINQLSLNRAIHLQPSLALGAIKLADPTFDEISHENEVVYVSSKDKKRHIVSKIIYIFGVFVLAVSLLASINTIITNQYAKEQVQVLGEQTQTTDEYGVAEGTGSDPAESPISDSTLLSYVPQNPQDPRYIRVPSLGLVSRVKTLGIDNATGAVDAPRNIHDAGWYERSVRPGSGPGTSLLLGHVSGWTAPGVFKKIDKLTNNDTIIVENGEGRTFTYQVYKIETLHLDDIDMNKVLATEKAGEHDVKLMTCAGTFNSETEEYDSRTIVYAREIK